MPSELHVKNLALIEKADIEFGEGLNILTGETGAGKSIIIGSVTMALGGKVPKDIIRRGAEYAYVELLFTVTEPDKVRVLKEMDVCPDEGGTVIISRKIMPARSPVSYTHLDVYKRQDIDIETLEWLEKLILEAVQPVLFISHDETLIERTANVVIHIEQLKRKTESRYSLSLIHI